ncbi:hypothetical protein BDQ17DRAFT_1396179 [Cyathus striatus]|nr:hypothetical protein BDQ17DRAFT_1396179 [Cyathus striatus]
MTPSPFSYSSYYTSPPPPPPQPSQHFPQLQYPEHLHLPHQQDYSMSPHDQSLSQSMHPPPSPSIPIDPASLYTRRSDTIGTPPTEHMYPSSSSNVNGKRPASAISNSTVDSRKKARKDESEPPQSPAVDKEEPKRSPPGALGYACTVCRRLKMKCVGAEQGPPCKRCQTGNHECIFEESNRGKRSSKKHELLTRSLRKMERTLDTVLRSIGNPSIASGMLSRSPSPGPQNATTQALLAGFFFVYIPTPPAPGSPKLHSLPDNSLNPLGLLAEASLANRRAQAMHPSALVARSTNPDEQPKVGVASQNYFKPGPMTILPLRRLYIERQIQPEMLSFVSTEEVVALFNIYFDHINMHCNLLDRNFHTPSLVCSRSPFLLTTICSIASKFYTEKPDLHPRLTELAKKLAFSGLQRAITYLLLALWGCGAVERFEQDKTWLLLGMAIRMATDLNLHRKTAVASQDTQEGKARDHEVHNRERTWIVCFCLDRSFSAQMGKPHSIKEDYIIRHADDWYRAPAAIPSDASLAGYAELQRILSRSLDFLYAGADSASGLQTNIDYMLVIKTFETQVMAWKQMWCNSRLSEGEPTSHVQYKKLVSEFYFHYAMLVLNSFGLQNALERTPVDIGHFFGRVHSSAISCATIVRDHLGPTGFMKYSPDSHFVQTSYAVLSLLKLVRPEFQAFLDNEQATLSLVKDVADVLDNISANHLHTPALYSGFLRALIAAKLEPQSNASGDVSSLNDHQQSNISHGEMPPPSSFDHHHHPFAHEAALDEFQFGEMGPVADMSTFPPTMAPVPTEDHMSGLAMENILSSGFWDSMLVPGYNSMDGLSGGFIFGAGGSGMITPRFGPSPMHSGTNTPGRGHLHHHQLTQTRHDGIKVDS